MQREKGQLTNTTHKTKDRATRTSLKTWGEIRFSRSVRSSCSISDTHQVAVKRHKHNLTWKSCKIICLRIYMTGSNWRTLSRYPVVFSVFWNKLIRKDMDVNVSERLSNITLKDKLKQRNGVLLLFSIPIVYNYNSWSKEIRDLTCSFLWSLFHIHYTL